MLTFTDFGRVGKPQAPSTDFQVIVAGGGVVVVVVGLFFGISALNGL